MARGVGGRGGILKVGQVFETLWQLFVILEHDTCLHYVIQLGNPFVSESFELNVSSYSFDSFKENLCLSSHSMHRHTLLNPSKRTSGCRHMMVIITSCLDPFLIDSNDSNSIFMPPNVQGKYQP